MSAVAGDVGTDGLGLDEDARQMLATCDVVIHSAATVSFDSPLDRAVEVNLLGPSRVASAVVQARADVADAGQVGPTHTSPSRRPMWPGPTRARPPSSCSEGNRYSLDVDWRGEVAAAQRLRSDPDAESRHPNRLASFTKAARGELGGAGTHLLAERAERLREDWVRRSNWSRRARPEPPPSAGPMPTPTRSRSGAGPDGPVAGDLPITIVRPSIIESALAEPVPGWIRGFRMAEPIIVVLRPGAAQGIPRCARRGHRRDPRRPGSGHHHRRGRRRGRARTGPSVYHVASGVRNPFRYGRLVELVQAWFTEHPIYDSDGQPIVVPEWSFPGRGRVQRQLQRAGKVMEAAERIVGTLPVRGRQASLDGRPGGTPPLADRALGYVELYGAYAETEARYRVDRLLALWDRIDDDQRAVLFRPGGDRLGPLRPRRPSPFGGRPRPGPHHAGEVDTAITERTAHKAILSPDRHLAVFDLENTLIASNVVDSYAWLATRHLPPAQRVTFVADLVREAPGCSPSTAATEATSSGPSTGATRAHRSTDCAMTHGSSSTSCCWPSPSRPAFAGLREHRPLGHRTMLSPAPSTWSSSRCDRSSTTSCAPGRASATAATPGELEELPPIGEARALLLTEYTERAGPPLERVGRLRRLVQRPAHARGGRVPGRGQPRGQAGRHRPAPGLARRALAKAAAAPGRRSLPLAPAPARSAAGLPARRPDRRLPMKALVFERNLPRFAASRVAAVFGSGSGAGVGAAAAARRGASRSCPERPGTASAPCCRASAGRDLATLDGRSSRYFEDIVSFPFVPGHEVVGVLDEASTTAAP